MRDFVSCLGFSRQYLKSLYERRFTSFSFAMWQYAFPTHENVFIFTHRMCQVQRSRLQTKDVRNTCEGKTTTTQRILSRPGSVISSIKNFKNNKLTLAEGRVIMSDISVCNTNL